MHVTKNITIMRNLFITLLLSVMSATVWGQRSITVKTSVQDYVTHALIRNSMVELLSEDSTIIDSCRAAGEVYRDNRPIPQADVQLVVPHEGKYILRVYMEGYDTAFYPLSINKIRRRELTREISPLYLKRPKERHLDGVTVTATKIKFYNRGDTLVYNADAFQMPDGSLLDALIRQLPGAELKDGRIYVNGRFVENLTLNGHDFFKGNNQVMLENLPTYMVSTIKVYDKQGHQSDLVGHDVGDKTLVMDVNLKKQYNIGWMGNLEGGGSTDSRYLGRLFMSRFTDHSQVSVYGNVNNVSDTRKPGEETEWTPERMPDGISTVRKGGINYSVKDRNGRFSVSGNAEISGQTDEKLAVTNRTNFLAGGDTYDRIRDDSRNTAFYVNTSHELYFKQKSWDLQVKPWFKYVHNKNRDTYKYASSNTSYDNFTKEQLDSLYTPTLSASLGMRLANRNIQESRLTGHSTSGGIDVLSNIKMKYSSDILTVGGSASFTDATEERFNRNRTDYPSSGNPVDFRNQYVPSGLGKGYSYKGSATYRYFVTPLFSLSLYYNYKRSYTETSRGVYRLDKLSGYGEDTDYELGMLPSEREYLSTIDTQNSYNSRYYEDRHDAGVFLWLNAPDENDPKWWVQMDFPVSFYNRRLRYSRGSADTTIIKRNTVMEHLNSTFVRWKPDKHHEVWLSYSVKALLPDLAYFVDYRDDFDPLNILVGNSDLKTGYRHSIGLSFMDMHPGSQRQLGVDIYGNFTRNALSMLTLYNRETGARTLHPDNVNGNWFFGGNVYYTSPLNEKRTLSFDNMLMSSYNHSVDLIGTDAASGYERSVVNNWASTETFRLTYQSGSLYLRLRLSGTWNRATGDRTDFTTINAFDYNAGVTARIKLPWSFALSTDFTLYGRRGYDDNTMNTDDFVWNARLSYTTLKGRLQLVADGFDILHQLSNVRLQLNAQGRTEVQTNVIPRYFMFHAIYRFNIMPGKKK